MIKPLPLLFCLSLFITPIMALAWQTKSVQESRRVVLPLSATEITRISVLGDRIEQLVGPKGAYRLEHNAQQGDIYLQPTTPHAFSVWLRTEKGHHLTLLLNPLAMPAEGIQLEVSHAQ